MENIREILTRFFNENEKIAMAFLYGSYANGKPRLDSDVDIAVYLQEPFSDQETDVLWNSLSKLLKKDVELLVLNRAKERIAWSAIRGIPLAIKDWKLYLEFMLKTSYQAMEFNDVIKDIWRIKRKLEHA